jgi:hypothetical protein
MFKQLSFRKWILSGAALALVLYANKLPVLIDGRTVYAPVAAFFVSMRLERVIYGPVLQLAQAVQTVALEKN